MGCTLTKDESARLFALIGFVPGALGAYLDLLRQQLVPGCPFKSHVTLLPPRLLSASADQLSRRLSERLLAVEPFKVSLGTVEVFPASGVVYLGIEEGGEMMRQIHRELAQDEFAFTEAYPFHPHVTLAQEFPTPQADEVVEHARSLWKAWKGEKRFRLDRLSFVQGADLCTWQTVSEHALNHSRRLRTA